MGQKKNKTIRIIIIVLLVSILLLGGIMAYLYVFTDILKSNKQLFFQYTSQIVQNEDGFIDKQVMQYIEKKKSTSYENEGNISFNIIIPTLEEKLELTNNVNVDFSGKIDANNAKEERQIRINYSDNVKFPFTYRRSDNIMGIQTQYIGNNFVAIRNDNENSEYEAINRISEIQNIQFSNEEIQNLKTRYFDNILKNLEDSKFSKIIEGDLTGYKLTLSAEEFKNICVQILDSLKTDENTISKINEVLNALGLSSKIDAEQIDEMIQNINTDLDINHDIEFTVFEKEKMLTRISFGSIVINKEENQEDVSYTISANRADESEKMSLNIKYTGLQSDTINEHYELEFVIDHTGNIIEEPEKTGTNENDHSQNTTMRYQYTISNNVQFKDNVEIENLTSENAVILNDKDDAYVTNLMSAIEQRIIEVNKVQMEELGVSEDENPIQFIIPSSLLTIVGNPTQLNENEVNAFNEKFELYQSTNTKGATVKGLLTTIQNNNETEGNHQIEEINMDGEEYEVTEQNITYLKSTINVDDAYRVEFEKDSNTGLIYRAVINKR